MSMSIHFVAWPKNATTAVNEWASTTGLVEPSRGHVPARDLRHHLATHDPAVRLVATIRHPLDWLRSWWAHVEAAGPHNERVAAYLAHMSPSPTHPISAIREDRVRTFDALTQGQTSIALHDPLLRPGPARGLPLWREALDWYLRDEEGTWLVDAVILAESGRLDRGLGEVFDREDLPIAPWRNISTRRAGIPGVAPKHARRRAEEAFEGLPNDLINLLRGDGLAVWYPPTP